jgi:hypothetical protein
MSLSKEIYNICNNCGKEFYYESHYERHINCKRKCKRKNKDNMCQYCKTCCSTKYTLERHYATCKKKIIQSKQNLDNQNIIMNNILKNIMSTIEEKTNIQNNEIQSMKTLLNQLIANNSNIPIKSSTNSNISIGQNAEVINNDNSHNTNTTNNTINNTINFTPNIIYPFGCEDLSFLSDEENLQILKMKGEFIPLLHKIYSQRQNMNHIKKNANKDMITIIDDNMDIKVYNSKDFFRKIAEQSVEFLRQIFYRYQPRLLFDHQLAILVNINEINYLITKEKEFTEIEIFLESRFQNSLTKEIFKKFTDKLLRNDEIKNEGLEKAIDIKKKINKFYKDINNNTIDDDFLQEEIWTKDITCDDADPDAPYNDLNYYRFTDTKRYKFFKERQNEEFNYFREHGISIGNLNKYRSILIDRGMHEIKRINYQYDNDLVSKNVYIQDATKAMINDTTTELLKAMSTIEFIQNQDMNDIINKNKENEEIDFIYNDYQETEDIIENENYNKINSTDDKTTEIAKDNELDNEEKNTIEKMVARYNALFDGPDAVLNSDGEYEIPVKKPIKKIKQKEQIQKPLIPSRPDFEWNVE